MNASEAQSFLEESRDEQRRADIEAGQRAAEAWHRQHPPSLDDYLRFLESMQRLFGPIPGREPSETGEVFLL